ncbi:hypothetical protein PF005_g8223 [Phytophthora fragariae]|uniref:Uncharacterized protein n=1 Tax=Phytophthora fragariae TaxID=53985 RepID=A0A6A3FN75_9STRA|nr:hypothetical protein PF003_g455 [Phytophthora fragariae]KAE8946603.1 hypothetical protein PF009_g3771 [Phytophthora fragariae]KAE9120310.1 hypothetical protein PF007_g8217 [Phytophthora fragariae]KAE9139224.1 hypothetical protein PF010_g675 [Phytophthora fragariae]KAE9152913.1 hypothetical protein PF006_g2901 [Phytophthora fragariae]
MSALWRCRLRSVSLWTASTATRCRPPRRSSSTSRWPASRSCASRQRLARCTLTRHRLAA